MHSKTMGLVLLGVFLFGLSSLAGGQRPVPVLPVPGPAPIGRQNPAKPKGQSCAQQAGISKAIMRERRSIMEGARAQVAAVCAEPISDAEKLEKIREIRRAERERMNALITSEQLQKLEECEKARGGKHTGAHPAASHPGGPCAESPH